MKAHEARSLAREWIEETAHQFPGFVGAHLNGTLNTIDPDADFAPFRDIDIRIVVESANEREALVTPYQGRVIEAGFVDADLFRSAEAVLANTEVASMFARGNILKDTNGRLGQVLGDVARDLALPRWIRARVDGQLQRVRAFLGQSRAASDVHAGSLIFMAHALTYVTGTIAELGLRVPTYRRSYALTREVLQRLDRLDLYEEMLVVSGFAHLEHAQVEALLPPLTELFDLAVQVKRTPTPFSFKMTASLRSYVVEGARELLQEGLHREAMYWIQVCFFMSCTTLELDGSDAQKALVRERQEQVWSLLKVPRTPSEWTTRLDLVQALVDKVVNAADDILQRGAVSSVRS